MGHEARGSSDHVVSISVTGPKRCTKRLVVVAVVAEKSNARGSRSEQRNTSMPSQSTPIQAKPWWAMVLQA